MKLILTLVFLGLSACSMLNRSANSGYEASLHTYDTPTDFYEQRKANTQHEAREELGLLGRPLTDDERQQVERRIRLKRQESRLTTKREKQQYYQARSHLRTDNERSYFLSLPTLDAKRRWAESRGIGLEQEGHPEEIVQVIEKNDIALGMNQKAVSESWGDPDAVEVAGDPVYGFERWRYNRYVSGNDGYQKEMRIVYFEGGRVVGWERP